MILYEKHFVEYLDDWINLHKKNETADAVFKNSIVILLKTLFWNKKPKNVTGKLNSFSRSQEKATQLEAHVL